MPSSTTAYTNSAAFVSNFIDQTGHVATFEEVKRGGRYQDLRIPRRPQWEKGMTAQEIAHNENLAFLDWRRDIASQE